ncbi:hypothetical protein D915_003551 [Fasciola hepatica]|uniref:Uncharacterized protein n=1 Tax=Fasciola hepatica TaxID=6192 RepID=A0A4E0RF22_FASHE|nr:hypothetical protein D915_003551 [Fasciola hepatica]
MSVDELTVPTGHKTQLQMQLDMLHSYVKSELTPKLPLTELVTRPLSPIPRKPFMLLEKDCFSYSSVESTAFGRAVTNSTLSDPILMAGNPTRSTSSLFRPPHLATRPLLTGSLKRKYNNGRNSGRNRAREIESLDPTGSDLGEDNISKPKQMKPSMVRRTTSSTCQPSRLWWPINEHGHTTEHNFPTQVTGGYKKPPASELSSSPAKSPASDGHPTDENSSTPRHSSSTNSSLTSPQQSHSNNDSPKSVTGLGLPLLGSSSAERKRSNLDENGRFVDTFPPRKDSLSYLPHLRNSAMKPAVQSVRSGNLGEENAPLDMHQCEQWLTACFRKLQEPKNLATSPSYRGWSTIPHPMTLLRAQMTLLQCQKNLTDFIQRSYRGKSGSHIILISVLVSMSHTFTILRI